MSRKSFNFIRIVSVFLVFEVFSFTYPIYAQVLSGRVYEGETGTEPPPLGNAKPIEGVIVSLYGSDDASNDGTGSLYIQTTTTNSEGWYSLTVRGAYDFYNIVQTNKVDYIDSGATSVGGTVKSSNWIQYRYEDIFLTPVTMTGNKFWDKLIASENNPPVANNDSATTSQYTAVDIDVLFNDTDPDGDPLQIISVTSPAYGTTVNHVTYVTYIPSPVTAITTFIDIFDYTVGDGKGETDTATVTVTVEIGGVPPADEFIYQFEGPSKITGTAGTKVTQDFYVTLTNYVPVEGWVIAAGSSDVALISFVGADTTGTVAANPAFAEFQRTDIYPSGSPTGATSGVVLDFEEPHAGQTLDPSPQGQAHKLLRVTVEATMPAVPTTVTLEFIDGELGNPPLSNVVVVEGLSVPPQMIPKTITLEPSESPSGEEWDFGDAPDSYGTSIANNGASHIAYTLRLGPTVDTELDGHPSPDALGDDNAVSDDEDGLVSSRVDGSGGEIRLKVWNVGSANEDAGVAGWIDFDGDHQFHFFDEAIGFQNVTVPAGGQTDVLFSFTVPTSAPTGETFARFRLYWVDPNPMATHWAVLPIGEAGKGEVEDYVVEITNAEAGSVVIIKEANPQDDTAFQFCVDYAPGGFFGTLCQNLQDPSNNQWSLSGLDRLESVTETITSGWTLKDITITGDMDNGSTIDLANATVDVDFDEGENIVITFKNEKTGEAQYDFGDAPANYPSASHELGGPWLGSIPPDAESGMQPNPPGLGDDNTGIDDEDCVNFLSDLVPGQYFGLSWKAYTTSNLPLETRCWIDFNRDGDWDDPGEFIVGGGCSGCTWNMVSFSNPVPAVAKLGKTYARFRVSSDIGNGMLLAPSGYGGPGEVEDYEVEIKSDGVLLPPGEIVGGVKFNDLNGNHQQDAGEPGLANWTIWIDLNDDGIKDAGEDTLTNSDGTFYFMALNPRTYTVHEDMPTGWYQTYPGGAGTQTIKVQDGQPTPSILFGNRLMGDEKLDFGDAPDSYKTLKASGGPCHKAGPLTLGHRIDIESDGVPLNNALGDDNAGIDDEDGITDLTELNLIAGQPGVIHVTVVNNDVVQNNATVAGWLDFNGDGQFNAAVECIGCQSLFMGAGGTFVLPFPFAVPANAPTGTTYARFRLYRMDTTPLPPGVVHGFSPAGVAGSTGEVEDYVVTIQAGVSPDDRDYGDAPYDGIATFYPSANHQVGGPWWGDLSDLPDVESGMQRDSTATGDDTDTLGDDENGLLGANLVQGQSGGLYVSFVPGGSGDVTLHGWVDFNHDGDWDDAGEASGPWAMAWGPSPTGGWPNPINVILPFAVPAQAQVGQTFARLRIEEGIIGFISPAGPAGAGEVEDHLVEIKPSGTPLPATGMIWGIKFQDLNGNRTWEVGAEPVLPNWTIWLDANQNGVHDAGDTTTQTDGLGLFAFTGLSPGTYLVGEEQQTGWIQTWPAAPGTHTVMVQANTLPWGILFGNLNISGVAKQFDWGDAPDPNYPTLRASNGAYHVIVPGIFLGGGVDPDSDGQPAPDARGDDSDGSDDEDGVTFITPIMPGQQASVEVMASVGYMDAWIDFDADGNWSQASDQIFQSKFIVAAGSYVLNFQVPAGTAIDIDTYARFRFSSAGGLAPDGPAQDGEVEDYHILLGENGPGVPAEEQVPHVKWSQPPIEIDPKLEGAPIFCGWSEPARTTEQSGQRRQWRMDADDFRCLGPIPVTRIRWWGGYKAWTQPEPPESQPEAWHIGIWANQVEGVTQDESFPERMVWSLEIPAERIHFEPVGHVEFPEKQPDTCFLYEVRLEPEEWFSQVANESNYDTFWISITAVYPADAEAKNMWGWTTRPNLWGNGAVMPAIMGEWPTYDERLFPGRIYPIENTLLCGRNQGYDMCFELLTEHPWVKWDQPFMGLRDWPDSKDQESFAIDDEAGNLQIERQVADDWLCERIDPVVAISWQGSYIGYGYEAYQCDEVERPRRPDYFILSLRMPTDVPAQDGNPSELVWEYFAYDYDEVLVGYDRNPEGQPNESVFRYSVRLPEDSWFRQEHLDQIYWFSVVAVYRARFDEIQHPWGWTNRPHMFGSTAISITRDGFVPELVYDQTGEPVDMSFTLFTAPQ